MVIFENPQTRKLTHGTHWQLSTGHSDTCGTLWNGHRREFYRLSIHIFFNLAILALYGTVAHVRRPGRPPQAPVARAARVGQSASHRGCAPSTSLAATRATAPPPPPQTRAGLPIAITARPLAAASDPARCACPSARQPRACDTCRHAAPC